MVSWVDNLCDVRKRARGSILGPGDCYTVASCFVLKLCVSVCMFTRPLECSLETIICNRNVFSHCCGLRKTAGVRVGGVVSKCAEIRRFGLSKALPDSIFGDPLHSPSACDFHTRNIWNPASISLFGQVVIPFGYLHVIAEPLEL